MQDIINRNAEKYQEYADAFMRTFEKPLRKYWPNHLLGFDIIKFDNDIGAGNNCLSDYLLEHYGEKARAMVADMVGLD